MLSHTFRRPVVLTLGVFLSGAFLFHQAINGAVKPRSSERSAAGTGRPNALGGKEPGSKKLMRLREGFKLENVPGSFTRTGETEVVFNLAKEERIFAALPNLALDRVLDTIEHRSGNSGSELPWTVSGVVTEFRGENYLLVTRAQIVSRKKTTGTKRNRSSRSR